MAGICPRGVYPMLYAMFDEGGRLRRDAVAAQVEAAVAAGADGVAVLGLGTEGRRLDEAERRELVGWLAEDLAGRLPFAVTVGGADPAEQAAFARFACDAGAAWVLLQPPPERVEDAELITFFGAVAERVDGPVGIQNAPEFLGYGLDIDGLVALNRAHPNVTVVKAETSAVEVDRLVQRLEGRMAVFNGRAGLELVDNLRAGAAGMIPGIETVDLQAACVSAFGRGDTAGAENLYAHMLPTLAFIMQGVDHFVRHGKLIAALRLGLELAPQARSGPEPSSFGRAAALRFSRHLGPLPRPMSRIAHAQDH